jgi:hypothetical protein
LRPVAWIRAFTGILAVAAVAVPSAQTPSARLIQAGDLVHQGSFTIPDMRDLPASADSQPCEYVRGAIAYNPAANSLFLVCHDWTETVAELGIPALGSVAAVRQQPRDPLDGQINTINPTDPNAKKIGGLFVLGNRLLVSAYSFYDGASTAQASHFLRSTDLTVSDVQGPVRIGAALAPGFTSGYMGAVPAEWQAALGGAMLTGNCCLNIISRTSSGPSVSVFSPGPATLANPTPAVMVLGYPLEHPTLGACEDENKLFNCASSVTGVVFPVGTRSVLFFGRLGVGHLCYKDTGDPSCRGTSGYNTTSYEPFVWAYDANDLVAVKQGRKSPWDVRPYAAWALPGLSTAEIGGAAYDPATGRLFVTERFGDGTKPRIHIFTIAGGIGASASCSYAVSSGAQALLTGSSIRMGIDRSQAVLAVAPSQADCAWTALAGADWLSVTPAMASGDAQVVLTASANPAVDARSSYALVAGLLIDVTQDGSGPLVPRSRIPRLPPRWPYDAPRDQ